MRTFLQPSDVVLMYVSGDPDVYARYGVTVSAWGGAHTQERVRALRARDIHSTGAMWCLTATVTLLHDDPDLRDATVRDIAGEPLIVPWLPDHVYQGTPALWGCTNHPAFRAHVRQKVCEAMAGGADGLHVDDHLGTAFPALYEGGCFCDYCRAAFRHYLCRRATPALLAEADVTSFEGFDYRALIRPLAPTRALYLERRETLPLYRTYIDFQLQRAAEHVRQLGALAAEIVERPITLSANTCLPLIEHTVVMRHLTHLVGEVAHHAEQGVAGLSDAIRAYRMADALGKPLAATAKGSDWAFVKTRGCANLVRLWIALSYACGQRLMCPHKAWCYIPGQGTEYYYGPAERYAPLYRFVRRHADLFDGHRPVGPLAPPPDLPAAFDTWDQRETWRAALEREAPQPLSPAEHIWAFPRRRADGHLTVHCLNLDYHPADDRLTPRAAVTLALSRAVCGGPYRQATWHTPDAEPQTLALTVGDTHLTVTLPALDVWGILEFHGATAMR